MEMVRFILPALLCLAPLEAAEFTLTIGNPIAANMPRMKTASLAVRLENCADLSKASLTATAEGLAAGERKSIPLQAVAGTAPGVYALAHAWPFEGSWVVNLKATCENAKAGAVVPFRGMGFVRESTKVFSRFATAAEIDGALKETSGGPK